MMSNVNILFNTNKYYIDMLLPELEDKLSDIVYSSSDLLVYTNNNLEVMVNKIGTVSISPLTKEFSEFKEMLQLVINEYQQLSILSNKFDQGNSFKVISPKDCSKMITNELSMLQYNTHINHTGDYDTVTVSN